MSDKKVIDMHNVGGLAGIEIIIGGLEAGDEVKVHRGDHWGIDIVFNGDSYNCVFGDDYKSYPHEYRNKYELMWDIAMADEWGGI